MYVHMQWNIIPPLKRKILPIMTTWMNPEDTVLSNKPVIGQMLRDSTSLESGTNSWSSEEDGGCRGAEGQCRGVGLLCEMRPSQRSALHRPAANPGVWADLLRADPVVFLSHACRMVKAGKRLLKVMGVFLVQTVVMVSQV